MMTEVHSDDAMKALGAQLGAAATGGEVIEMVGDVGAGKTTFTKGFAAGLGVEDDVQSPSFTISRVYEAARDLRLVHYDFYRLHDAGILRDELAENQAAAKTVTIIEWADIVDDVLPADRLQIAIVATDEHSRRVELAARGPKAQALLEKIS